MALLSKSEDVRGCVARQFLRFAVGRSEGAQDESSLAAAKDAFARAGDDLRELAVAIVSSPTFLNRQAPEVSP
jgi:hypothetical protein